MILIPELLLQVEFGMVCYIMLLKVSFLLESAAVSHPSESKLRCPNVRLWSSLNVLLKSAEELLSSGRRITSETHESLIDFSRIMQDSNVAFDCPIGAASLYHVIARAFVSDSGIQYSETHKRRRVSMVALRLMHIGMNWLTYAFVVNGKNDAHWVDESSWPLTLESFNTDETNIRRFLDSTGGSTHPESWGDVPYDLRDPTLRIGIASVCDYPSENPLSRLSRSNREMYSKRHGYQLFEVAKRYTDQRPHAWAKITLLLDHINKRDLDWLLWFDCDTYFMNFTVTLDHMLYKYGSEMQDDGTRRLRTGFRMLVQEDQAMLNTGVFFIKTGPWSLQLLRDVYGQEDSKWINHPFWEQASMANLFLSGLQDRARDLYDSKLRVFHEMENIYPDEVVVAPQSLCNSYHPITSRVHLHDNWEPGKAVLAFSGCRSASSDTVVHQLYLAYYDLMCKLNQVEEDCLSIDEA
jgi:hypothetical protein